MSTLQGIGDGALRLAVFALVLALMADLETIWPKRARIYTRARRWTTNLALAATGSVAVRALALITPLLLATGAATLAAERGWGLLNLVQWPAWAEIALALVVLDLAIWVQHVASHKVPLLWRLHRMHHADPEIDATTGIRFHPIEIALSMLWKVACVLALGASPAAVLAFEVILNACALFNHANLAMPRWLDRLLRLAVVTPDMHRVHHSVLRREHDANYGFNLSVWDRLLGTYVAEPEHGHQGMRIGLTPFEGEAPTRLGWSLLVPWQRPADRT